jgi:superfamily II DNA or RNA helicase
LADGPGGHGDEPATVDEVEASLAGRFRFVAENDGAAGLRAPQLGALHAILATRSIGSAEPVTIVLPTGTGKTETMLAAYCHQPRRTLIVVPSDSLRTQIGRKFATLGILHAVGAIEGDYRAPTVGIVKSRLETAEQVRELTDHASVIVATAAALGRYSAEALQAIVDVTHQLFIDEAHHVAARTWTEIASAFRNLPIVQFTATPFREDGRIVDGRIAYAYPLRLAQENGWFARINYRSITSGGDVDRELATIAVGQLRDDLAAGLDHILMARVQTISRADALLSMYEELAADLHPLRIDSKLALAKQREARARLDDRSSRIVICVDMLGEGFDLPSLKVAAVHDPHKSLAVTLQFVGRFTRVGGEKLGEASVLVPRVRGVLDERLRRLYGEDADWNTVVRDLTHAEVEYEQARTEFEAGFGQLPAEVAIRAIQPKMSTVIYRSPTLGWNPTGVYDVFDETALLTKRIGINEKEKVVWFVTAEATPVRWGDFSTFTEIVHHLYVIHVDETTGLLYVNSSNNESIHQELARAVGGDEAELIRGDIVYRVLAPITRRVPTNVGLLDAVNRNRRFSMHVGADVLEGFGPGAAQKSKTNIFAHGYAERSRVSFGASRKGRIWSHRVSRSVLDWVRWARGVGAVVTDESIDIRTVMSGFIIPKAAVSRPELVPLGVEWPHDIGLSTSEARLISYNGVTHPLIDLDLTLRTFTRKDPIEFDVVSEDWSLRYVFTFDDDGPAIIAVEGDAMVTLPKGETAGLARFMSHFGLAVYFENEALLSPDGFLLQPDRMRPRFSADRLESVDWSGIDIRKESQGPDRNSDSVQHRVAEVLAGEAVWEVVLDDDGTGEIADLVFLRRDGNRLEILLAHCKYSGGNAPGARVGDLYEVCGQAAKCHKARSDVELTIRRAIRREQARQRNGLKGLIVGTIDTLHTMSYYRKLWMES